MTEIVPGREFFCASPSCRQRADTVTYLGGIAMLAHCELHGSVARRVGFGQQEAIGRVLVVPEGWEIIRRRGRPIGAQLIPKEKGARDG